MHESRPSSTAFLIARALLLASHEPALRGLLPPDAATLSARFLAAAGWRSRWVSRALDFSAVRKSLLGLERTVLPGLVLHFLLRKRWLEELVRAAVVDDGCRQVVVLGAGLDTLASRLHRELDFVRFIEVDHPATQRLKKSALTEGELATQNLVLLPADLTNVSLATALLGPNSGFARDRRTLLLAEGLLMYLPAAAVERLFTEIHARLPEITDFVFTFMEPRADGSVGFARSSALVNPWLRWRSEPFRWAAAESELAASLLRCGWKIKSISRAAEFRRRYLANDAALASWPLAEGEAICVAQRVNST